MALDGRKWVLAVVAGICGSGVLFALFWFVMGLSGWLVWAVIAACLCALSFAVGWVWPHMKLQTGE